MRKPWRRTPLGSDYAERHRRRFALASDRSRARRASVVWKTPTHSIPRLRQRSDILVNYRGVGKGPADPAAAGPIIRQARIFMFTLYQFSRTWVDSSRIYAIRRQILMLKCTKFDFRWGFAPDRLAGLKAPTSKRGRRKWREGAVPSACNKTDDDDDDDGEWRKKWGPYYHERGKKEVDRREGKGGKGRGRDLPDQCQTASYAPEV